MKLGKTEHNSILRLYIRKGKIHGGFSVEIIYSQMYDHYFFKVYNKMKSYVYDSSFDRVYFTTENECIVACEKFVKDIRGRLK